ncbi:kinase subdomain-containing protein [Lophium mytilinum]|uniref:Kinase subdomain-containing protein n=1 Tax=Lophium mytilinum TaxID=390894 RepID=A0A6A6R238_9PEZI|nr:kinase subdomain-containing protein [Lophium mytilinum]
MSSISVRFQITKLGDDSELFEYTSGRWIFNEQLRLAERRLVFDVKELKRVVADRVGMNVKSFCKLAEGGFNRVFEITMADNTQILARLPYPSTQPKGFAVASEVATLKLLRHYGLPVPRVLGYSTDSSNPVGSEYILMEKVPGRSLGDRWFDLTEKERLKVTMGVVEMEAKLFSIDIPAYGSIYHGYDLPPETARVSIPSLRDCDVCVGPNVEQRWWHEERSLLDIDRGPYLQPIDVLRGLALKELAWLQEYGKPRLPFERAYREELNFQKSSPVEHATNIQKYLGLVQHLVPKEKAFLRPTLRHPDLQPQNIFVSDTLDIVGVIDWQHCSVLPLFLAYGIPKYFQNHGDEQSLIFVAPKLPGNLEDMDEEDRAAEMEQYRRRHLHFFYLGFTSKYNKPHWDALQQGTGVLKRKLFSHAGNPWEGNNVFLKADFVIVQKFWKQLVEESNEADNPCPITYTNSDVEKITRIIRDWELTDTGLEYSRRRIGITVDGWTSNEEYDGAIIRAREAKQEVLDSLDDEFDKEMTARHWPLDDHDEKE